MNDLTNADKRKSKRATVSLEARWEGLSGSNPQARVSDISLDGCFLETIGYASPDDQIQFSIQTSTGNWLQLRGEVVYTIPTMGFGLRFVSLTLSEREVLENLIECQPE